MSRLLWQEHFDFEAKAISELISEENANFISKKIMISRNLCLFDEVFRLVELLEDKASDLNQRKKMICLNHKFYSFLYTQQFQTAEHILKHQMSWIEKERKAALKSNYYFETLQFDKIKSKIVAKDSSYNVIQINWYIAQLNLSHLP